MMVKMSPCTATCSIVSPLQRTSPPKLTSLAKLLRTADRIRWFFGYLQSQRLQRKGNPILSAKDVHCSRRRRGSAWVHYPADPTQRPGGAESDLLYNADNLNGAVLDKARQAHQRRLWDSLCKSTPENQTSTPGDTPSDTRRAKKGAAERLHDVHEQSGGVHEQISYGFWTTSRHSHIQPILRARFDRPMTQKRRFRVLPVGQRPTSAICEHCWNKFQLTVEGDAQYEINECKRPELMALRTKRHDEALKAIHVAVARGAHSGCCLQADLPSTSGILRLADASGTETRQILPQIVGSDYRQKSRPDLLMITGRTSLGKRSRDGTTLSRQAAYIVELKFTSDDRVHGAALKEARTQHAALASRLESRRFRIRVLPIIVGSSGMIRRDTQQHLAALGLTTTESLSLMQEHHDTAIKYLRKFLQECRVLLSPPPVPRSKPRRVPKRTLIANPNIPADPAMHRRALPAAFSTVTRSEKRSRSDQMLCQNPSAQSSSGSPPCPARPWDRLIFTIGRHTGSVRRVQRLTRSRHTGTRGRDNKLRPSSLQERSTPPHVAVPPPASRESDRNTITL